jgi:hypothetical protein
MKRPVELRGGMVEAASESAGYVSTGAVTLSRVDIQVEGAYLVADQQ